VANHQFHDQVRLVLVHASLEHLDDIDVGDLGRRLALAQEALAGMRHVPAHLAKHLDRHVLAEYLVPTAVDHAHGSGPEPGLQADRADQCADEWIGGGHRRQYRLAAREAKNGFTDSRPRHRQRWLPISVWLASCRPSRSAFQVPTGITKRGPRTNDHATSAAPHS